MNIRRNLKPNTFRFLIVNYERTKILAQASLQEVTKIALSLVSFEITSSCINQIPVGRIKTLKALKTAGD